jgi:hypothetical protein
VLIELFPRFLGELFSLSIFFDCGAQCGTWDEGDGAGHAGVFDTFDSGILGGGTCVGIFMQRVFDAFDSEIWEGDGGQSGKPPS